MLVSQPEARPRDQQMSRGDATQASCHAASSALSSCFTPPSAPTAGLTGRPADSSPQLPVMCRPSKYTGVPGDAPTAATGTEPVLHPRCLTLCLFCRKELETNETPPEVKLHLLQNVCCISFSWFQFSNFDRISLVFHADITYLFFMLIL